MSAGSEIRLSPSSKSIVRYPMCSMSIPPLPEKWNSHSRTRDEHSNPPVHRATASPSKRTIGLSQNGHFSGMVHFFSLPVRAETTGPTTSGITSPARRTITWSPIRTSLRAT